MLLGWAYGPIMYATCRRSVLCALCSALLMVASGVPARLRMQVKALQEGSGMVNRAPPEVVRIRDGSSFAGLIRRPAPMLYQYCAELYGVLRPYSVHLTVAARGGSATDGALQAHKDPGLVLPPFPECRGRWAGKVEPSGKDLGTPCPHSQFHAICLRLRRGDQSS